MHDPWSGYTDPPRAWQAEAYPLAMQALRARDAGVLAVCTGAGKTRLQIAVLRTVLATLRPGWAILVTVPRQALVEQTYAEAVRVLGRGVVGRYYGRRREPSARIVIACHDSLDRLVDAWTVAGTRCALWMADECHRANAPVVQAAVAALQPWARIGLTATPYTRIEGEGLVGWSRLVYRYPVDRAIDDGVLVPWRPVVWRGDDLEPVETLVAMIRDHAPPGPGLVSAPSKDEAAAVADDLTRAGIPAASIDSTMTADERRVRLGRLLAGHVRCLVHVDLLTEGVDLPALRWLAMHRARGSAVAIVQEVGRVLRVLRAPDAWGEKREAVVLLPHLTPVLGSLARDPDLTPVAAIRGLREAAEREASGDPGEVVSPLAVSVGDVDGWISRVVEHVRGAGVEVRGRDPGPWRAWAPTSEQVRVLRELVDAGHRTPLRYLPGPHRDAVRAVVRYPEVLTAGTVSDLIAVLLGLRRHAGEHYRAHAEWWRGLVHADLGDAPEIETPRRRRAA